MSAAKKASRRLPARSAGAPDSLHILINNAGLSWGAELEDFPYKAWARVLDVNVTGLFHLTRELLPLLDKAGQPRGSRPGSSIWARSWVPSPWPTAPIPTPPPRPPFTT
jgi:NAD(P)-dependent dehydrogenase (short-subunit alcohol dehydrogenase family)